MLASNCLGTHLSLVFALKVFNPWRILLHSQISAWPTLIVIQLFIYIFFFSNIFLHHDLHCRFYRLQLMTNMLYFNAWRVLRVVAGVRKPREAKDQIFGSESRHGALPYSHMLANFWNRIGYWLLNKLIKQTFIWRKNNFF